LAGDAEPVPDSLVVTVRGVTYPPRPMRTGILVLLAALTATPAFGDIPFDRGLPDAPGVRLPTDTQALSPPARGDSAADLASEMVARLHASDALRDAVADGRLEPHEGRMQRFYASFRPDLLAPEFRGLLEGHPGCATSTLMDLRAHWSEVPAEQKHLIELESSPIYRSWLDDGGMSWLEGDVDKERAVTRAACFDPQNVNGQLGPYSEITTTEHFELHWTPGGAVTQARTEDLLEWLEDSWQFQVVDNGFFQPHGLSTNQMLVTVEELNSPGIGAYATLGQCFSSPSGFMTYIVVNEWSFQDLEWLRSVAPHEFFHGVQPVYAIQEFWLGQSDNRWLVEASATYMQRVTYDWLVGVEAQQALRWATEPHRSLETADDSGLQYGLVVFLLSIEESLGTNDWHQELWEQIRDRQGFDLRDEFDVVLAEYDTDFLTEWRRFMIRGATGFELNDRIILPTELESVTNGQLDDAIVGRWDGRDFPIDEAVNSGSGHERPEYLGTNYVVFEGDRIDDDVGAIIRFRGDGNIDDRNVDWVVELAAVYNDSVRATHSMTLEYIEDGDVVDDVIGSVLVNEIGEDFDYVVMAVSPVTDFGDGVISWSYEAELADSTGQGGFVEVPEDDDGDGDGSACAGCGSSVGPQSGGIAWLTVLGLFMRRRRKGQNR